MKSNSYLVYQLLSFFVMKFSYKIMNLPSQKAEEIFLINPTNRMYPLIRLTTASIEQVIFEKERLHETVDSVFVSLRMTEGRFLDIHVSDDIISNDEEFDSIAINVDHYSGPDLSDIYPGIKNAVHPVNDANTEIAGILSQLSSYSKTEVKQKRKIKIQDKPIVTYVTMAVCVIMYVITYFLENKYGSVNSLIFLGANYKTFTVGLNEVWRLVVCGFLHGSLWHLLLNMLSLYSLGNVLERGIGSLKYAAVLFGSLLAASLTSLAFGDNSVSVGISGGLYGLFAMYLVNSFYNHTLNNYAAMQVIVINLCINFMSGVDFMAHIGGLVAGIIFYFFLSDKRSIVLFICMIAILTYKVYFKASRYTIYGGTDMQVVEMYEDLGFKNHAEKTLENLIEVWGENQ